MKTFKEHLANPEDLNKLIQILNSDPGLVFMNNPLNRTDLSTVQPPVLTTQEVETLKTLGLTNLKTINF